MYLTGVLAWSGVLRIIAICFTPILSGLQIIRGQFYAERSWHKEQRNNGVEMHFEVCCPKDGIFVILNCDELPMFDCPLMSCEQCKLHSGEVRRDSESIYLQEPRHNCLCFPYPN